jgi:hypothetical protein
LSSSTTHMDLTCSDTSTQSLAAANSNPGKQLIRVLNEQSYTRIPVRTHVIKPYENMAQLLDDYVRPLLNPGDIVVLSEKMVAITQGRGFPIQSIKPTCLAYILSQFVVKSPYGFGLGSPWTLELAIREAGKPRIILAAVVRFAI